MNAPTFWRALILTLFGVYAIAFLYLFSSFISVSHRLGRAKSAALGALLDVVYQCMFLVFNR